MTDNEIIKALECCSYATYNSDCEKCPYYPDKECVKKQCTDILDLINRQKAEIDILIRKKETLRDEIAELQAEIERLNKENDRLSQVVLYNDGVTEMKVEEAKAEAIKEFAEKFKEKAGGIVTSCQGYEIYETKQYQISAINFDSLVKEMVGDDNG